MGERFQTNRASNWGGTKAALTKQPVERVGWQHSRVAEFRCKFRPSGCSPHYRKGRSSLRYIMKIVYLLALLFPVLLTGCAVDGYYGGGYGDGGYYGSYHGYYSNNYYRGGYYQNSSYNHGGNYHNSGYARSGTTHSAVHIPTRQRLQQQPSNASWRKRRTFQRQPAWR